MLNDYQAIRHRAMNTVHLEGKFTLINVNLRTVQLWFKDKTRQEEISTLVSSQHLPAAPTPSSSKTGLPPPRPKPDECPAVNPIVFAEPEDTSGKAKPRSTSAGSRTTQWRMKKAFEAAAGGDETSKKKVRKYTCPGCGGLATDPGHTQYRGKRFCPKAHPNIRQEDWIKEQKEFFEAKKAAKTKSDPVSATITPVLATPLNDVASSVESSLIPEPVTADEFSGFNFNTQDVLDNINTQELVEAFEESSINPMDF